ncbi:hypothetical protein M011DRAFT_407809 [Sporormia fimetaria CBS 119925]|uniref:Uncharacterized protein n=1 Tax=Sporormia fimetaria CBS 119925 TaxID=1340428 RepID=A0A6A6V5T6_9PLEO|nr:hypothetical protein M011DRAFT_407809 [Sporormia fimetaria CBS 119925]
MEAAIRWSPHSTEHDPRFLVIDVAANRLRLCQVNRVERHNRVKYSQLCVRDKLPNYTAFDWSKKDPNVVAIGTASGEAVIVRMDPETAPDDCLRSFPIKHQRKCNSIAFNTNNLLATGLDRVRNDVCLNIYDLNSTGSAINSEPYRKLASSEAISSIKFFPSQPGTLVAGVTRQCIRLYDLRDSSTSGLAQCPTRQVHNIAIDPLDENYFLSAGTTGDPTVSLWDQRFLKQRNTNDSASSEPLLEFRPIVDNSRSATIWSLRYSGTKRGMFGVLANTGEFKVIELAQHSHRLEGPPPAKLGPSARLWASPHYAKMSHIIRYPSYDENYQDEPRVVAYDFMATGSPVTGQCALALYPDKGVHVFKVPEVAPKVNLTALEEIYKDRALIARPSPSHGAMADDLIELQEKTLKDEYQSGAEIKNSLQNRLDKLTIDHPHRSLPLESTTRSSYEMHEELLTLGFPQTKLPLADYLKILQTQKRRCKEGYCLDCRKNKEIVKNDLWLVDAWSFVERMDTLSWGDGMVGNDLDLKYLGVHAIWFNKLEMYDQRLIDPDTKTSEAMFVDAVKKICANKQFPPFSGAGTRYPEQRQLCLALCGWNLSKKDLRERCSVLLMDGQYCKAIVLAVLQGYRDVASDLLKEVTHMPNAGYIALLGAVIACETVNEGQRNMCSWIAETTKDPYLKALLAYFTTGDWRSVVDMPQLALCDRVGAALKYLTDDELTHLLQLLTSETTAYGNIEGLLLTGFTNRAMDLIEHYIAKYGDLQSAVLILSRACPLYIQDHRWALWKDLYLEQFQVWRLFLQRAHYVKEHNLRCVTREGKTVNKPSAPSLAIRCHNCQQNLALRKDAKTSRQYLVPVHERSRTKRPGPQQKPQPPMGEATSPALACPNCNAQMPRCGICLMWLGSPDPSKVGAAQTLKEEDLEARMMVFCMNCTHGFHGHHARDWFARHAMCPVPDCQCMCGPLK